jgi:membrane protein implicated in regulation of membrane protease activity
MWLVAGVLLGLVVLVSLLGFHVGPHAHAAAGLLGLIAAAWLIVMAAEGRSAPVLWALLSADLVVSGGIGVMAWKGLKSRGAYVANRHLISPVGAEGSAIGDLDPEGIVRVNGENWSAVSLNGTVRDRTRVQVVKVNGVRLEVWGEDGELGNGVPQIQSVALEDIAVSDQVATEQTPSPSGPEDTRGDGK